jgi:hypothetical protein
MMKMGKIDVKEILYRLFFPVWDTIDSSLKNSICYAITRLNILFYNEKMLHTIACVQHLILHAFIAFVGRLLRLRA